MLSKCLHDPLIEGLQYNRKPLFPALFLGNQIVSCQALHQFCYEDIVPFCIFVALLFPLYLHQKPRDVVFQVALLHIQDFLDQLVEGRYSEGLTPKLWAFRRFLPYSQPAKLIHRKISHPPVVGRLAFHDVIDIFCFFGSELWQSGDVGHQAEVPIVEDHDLIVLGQQDVKLYVVCLVETRLNALQCVFGQETAVSSVGDDQWIVLLDACAAWLELHTCTQIQIRMPSLTNKRYLSKPAHPCQLLSGGLDETMLRLHGGNLAVPSVLHQKVLEVLFQHAFDHMLKSRVLLRQAKHLLQAAFYLALDEADLFVHFVQVRIVRNLLAVAGPFLLLSSLIKRHYSVALPQFLNLPEEQAHSCQLFLQLPEASVLHSTAILRISLRGSIGIGFGVDALPYAALVVLPMCDGLAVIEQFFGDRGVLVLEVGVYFRELGFGEDCSGCGPSLFGVGYHQQYYCKNNQRKVSYSSIYQDLDICQSLLLLRARPLMRSTGRTLCSMDLKDLPLSGIWFSLRWDYLRMQILSGRRSFAVVLLGDQTGELVVRVPLGLNIWKEI